MAQFYTLEEAARVLGMDPEDLKQKANANEIRPYRDGATLRFKVADIDELARLKGLGSEPELHLSDLDIPAASGELSEFDLNSPQGDFGGPTMELPSRAGGPASSLGDGSDHDILLDDLSLPPNPIGGSSSVIIGMDKTGKLPSDSDVRLVADNPKGASDSDVRMGPAMGFKAPSDSDVTLVADDTSSHEAFVINPADAPGRRGGSIGSSAELPAGTEPGSDFLLAPAGSSATQDADSGSDFELSALEEGSDEFEATPLKSASDSDVTAGTPGLSGINLSRPSDSGINLQMASGLNLGSDSIELAPLEGEDVRAATPPRKKVDTSAKDELSATRVPVRPEKDIFDDTDFEVDALASDGDGSDDKTMQLDAASDFELEESDTGSEVFAIDEEDVDQNAATSVGSSLDLDDDDDEADVDEFAEAASGEMSAGAWDVESETPSSAAGRAAPSPVLAAAGPSAEWGGLWVGMLGVTTVFMLLLTFVSLDLMRNLYDYRGDTPGSGLVKTFAGLISSQ